MSGLGYEPSVRGDVASVSLESNNSTPMLPTADRLSISIGIASYWPQRDNVTTAEAAALFEAADPALYRAKTGRP